LRTKSHIRAAEAKDIEELFGFITGLAHTLGLTETVTTTQTDLAKNLFGKNPRVFCHIAEVDGEAVGAIFWYYGYSSFAGRAKLWVEDLFVKPNVRGHGVAEALIGFLAAKCLAEGHARLEGYVCASGRPVHKFYQSLGGQLLQDTRMFRLEGDALRRLAEQSLRKNVGRVSNISYKGPSALRDSA
jgi:GNAT superfamily N-acetyltransferase